MNKKDIKRLDDKMSKKAEEMIALIVEKEMRQGNLIFGGDIKITFDIETAKMNISADANVISIAEVMNEKQ